MEAHALPISIDALLHGHVVEWERLEFKQGWNPQDVLHTICAFANDFHNLGGGYIVLGIKEQDGRPVLPPAGLSPNQLDAIQKEILNLGHSAIQPSYHPRSVPVTFQGQTILVIWIPAGETRPYRAKQSLSDNSNDWREYIRKQSSTVVARNEDLKELVSLTATVPFDDRYNQQASLNDLSLRLIEEFLHEVGSDLEKQAPQLSMEQLGRQMNIVGGPREAPFPKNIGLMMFNENPEKFFPVTQIDVVYFPDGPGGDIFEEKEFKGPIHRIIRDALSHIQRNYLKQTVIKYSDRAEADRIWNYPYAAIEEALVNAVYHRSYEIREPVEVRIEPDELMILSFPGPDRSIRIEDLAEGRAATRRYRNRRIGEFFKELELTEGRSTGIRKIRRAVEKNGSPNPVFETDEDRTWFLFRLPVHSAAMRTANIAVTGGDVEGEAELVTQQVTQQVRKILSACAGELSRSELMQAVEIKDRVSFSKNYLEPALAEDLVEMTQPDSPKSPTQKYRLTEKGKKTREQLK